MKNTNVVSVCQQLIAVHPENDPKGEGMAIAKAWAAATGGHKAGVLESSFVAEVKI